jgi:hypothetical protein
VRSLVSLSAEVQACRRLTCSLLRSPRWLFIHGHYDRASQIVADLNDQDLNDEDSQRQIRIIVEGINASSGAQEGASFGELFQGGKKQHFRRMMVGASSQVFQQLGGCNAVIYYATVLFENSIGLETRLSLILGGVLSVVYAIAACTSFLFVERAGRRKMFLIGSAGQMVAMIITFACLIPGTAQTAKGAAVGLFLYIVFFGSCWLPLPWLYPAELNPLRVRTKANAVSTMANWYVLATLQRSPAAANLLVPHQALQLPCRRGHPDHDRENRLGNFPDFRLRQRPLHPRHLLLLPGDQGTHAGGH